MNAITLNPNLTTVAGGSFNVTSEGFIQGTALQDPAVRHELSGGLVAPTETYPMWGGIAIGESVNPVATSGVIPNDALGGYISRAISLATMTGFTVFDQDHAMINTPQSPVPMAPGGGMINFYRFGSNARLAVAAAPSLIDLAGEIITSQVSWDFGGQQLVPYVAAYPEATPTSVVYTSATGILELEFAAPAGVVTGDVVNIFGSSVAALNGSWVVASTSGGGDNVFLDTVVGLGVIAPTGITLLAGGGAIPVRVLQVVDNNCMTVDFDPTTGFATWNRNGACAVILI